MNAKRIYSIFVRQFYLVRDNPTRLVVIFFWGILEVVLWGFITRYLNNIVASGPNFVSVFLGAVLLWDFLTRVLQGVTTAFFEDVWSRNFLNIFASPLKVSEYISGLVCVSIVTSLMSILVILVLAVFFFGFSFAAYGVSVFLFLLVLFFFGIALGIFAVGFVLRFGPASEWLIWPIPGLLAPFVGVFYPIATLPHWMQVIAYVLPPSYVLEGARTVLSGGARSNSIAIFSVLLSMLYIFLAYVFFLLVYRKAVRTGLLARYSAENAS